MKKTLVFLTLVSMVLGCSISKPSEAATSANKLLHVENDILKTIIDSNKADTKNQIATFLTFQENNAEEAMNFYVGLFENSEVVNVKRYGKDGPAKEGTIFLATFRLNGQKFMCTDSYIKHKWTFTPGVSVFVECRSVKELENLFKALSENGNVLMPLDNYGFSQKFGFLEDRFGISWQLNLP